MQQFIFDLEGLNQYSESDYIISESNRSLLNYLNRWPRDELCSNILIIYGSKNVGKTHLSHIWQKRNHAKFISQIDFYKYSPIEIISHKKYYILEDIENFIDLEIELLHLINLIFEQEKFLLITSTSNPMKLSIKLADLRSRILSFPQLKIADIDDELFKLICFKYFSSKQLRISDKVMDYMIHRIERSFISLKKIIDIIDKKALIEKRNVTIKLVREVIEHMNILYEK